jgi:uncharacterized tellurite resistance protein B-like protein
MLRNIKRFFEENLRPQRNTEGDPDDALQLATAALMMEMMRMDDHVTREELQKASSIIREKFGLTQAKYDDLIKLAGQEAGKSADYHRFTSLINRNYSMEEKEKVVEHLWEIAYADRELNKHEEYLVRKVADLIGVSHKAFIEAKHRARKSLR